VTVRWTPEAEADLEDAIAWITKDRPLAAQRMAARVLDAADLLAGGPFDGPEHVLHDGSVVRSWPVHPFRL
jgi:plasmid stabilization system protein ParE